MYDKDKILLEKESKGYKLTVYERGDSVNALKYGYRYGYRIDTPKNKYTPDMFTESNHDVGPDRADREITISTTSYGSLKVCEMDKLSKEMSIAVEVAKEFNEILKAYN